MKLHCLLGLLLLALGFSGNSRASTPVPPPIPERMSEPGLSDATRAAVNASFGRIRDTMRESEHKAPRIPAVPASVPEASFSKETGAKLEAAFARIAFVKPEALSSLSETSVASLGVIVPNAEKNEVQPQALVAGSIENMAAVRANPESELPPNLLVEQVIALQQEQSAEPSLFQRVHSKMRSQLDRL